MLQKRLKTEKKTFSTGARTFTETASNFVPRVLIPKHADLGGTQSPSSPSCPALERRSTLGGFRSTQGHGWSASLERWRSFTQVPRNARHLRISPKN